MQLVTHTPLVNNTQTLVEEFVNGEHFSEALGETVFNSFYPGSLSAYPDFLKTAKTMLNEAEVFIIDNDILVINTDTDVDERTKVAALRLANLAHQGKYIVVVKGEVIYVPERYKHCTSHELNVYVTLCIFEEKKRTSNAVFNALRTICYSVRLGFKKPEMH